MSTRSSPVSPERTSSSQKEGASSPTCSSRVERGTGAAVGVGAGSSRSQPESSRRDRIHRGAMYFFLAGPPFSERNWAGCARLYEGRTLIPSQRKRAAVVSGMLL